MFRQVVDIVFLFFSLSLLFSSFMFPSCACESAEIILSCILQWQFMQIYIQSKEQLLIFMQTIILDGLCSDMYREKKSNQYMIQYKFTQKEAHDQVLYRQVYLICTNCTRLSGLQLYILDILVHDNKLCIKIFLQLEASSKQVY